MKAAEVTPPPEAPHRASSEAVPPVQTGGGPLPVRVENLVGRRFGRLTVESLNRTGGKTYWNVRCDCGALRVVRTGSLNSGQTKSCGCLARELLRARCLEDLTGRRFGRLRALSFVGGGPKPRWLAECDCGRLVVVRAASLRTGNTKSCGCLRQEKGRDRGFRDLSGMRFGRLLVVGFSRYDKRHARWRVRCDCGAELEPFGFSLQNGATQSCGCRQRELARARLFNPALSPEDRYRARSGALPGNQMGALSKEIRRRDGLTCIVCGATCCMLHVHHLESWAGAPELRFDPRNLVTLCRECHEQFHAAYGTDTGLDDLEDYLE